MEILTDTLNGLTRSMEEKHDFKRAAVRDGHYRVRHDRSRKLSDMKPDELEDMGIYALAVSLLERYGKSEKELRNREVVERILNESASYSGTHEELLVFLMESQMRILKALNVKKKTGQSEQYNQLIEQNCIIIASVALRIRDMNKGIEEKQDGTIKLSNVS